MMDILDKIKETFGLDYEDLSLSERETLESWVRALEKNQITIEKIKDFVSEMKNSIIKDLIKTPEYDRFLFFKIPNRKHLFLKARLENIVLLEEFLFQPARVKKALNEYLESLKRK